MAPTTPRPPSRNATPGEKSTVQERSRSFSPRPKKKKQAHKLKAMGQPPTVKDNDIFLLPASDYQIMLALTVVATAVRLYKIWQPTSVVFDEVHFGGFATKYIKGKFFMDVHPPLAKMLIALVGWLAGFNGNFDFKEIGKDYLEPGVPYVAMRMLPAVMGTLVAPMMFLTLKAVGCSTASATLGAGLIIFENGLLTQARLILLDSPLVCFTAATAMSWTSFLNVHEQGPSQAFSPTWWFWLISTGLALGATVSVKWVGLFTIAWVGVLTVLQLWFLLGDTRNVTPRLWFKHLFARAFCLIVIPIGFYMAMFAIHFLCLVNPGDGDGFMSSEFQSTLNNKGMAAVPADVAFGSRVSIRHWNTQGGYLHSHAHMYPTGSKQQQITLYPHKDNNNIWVVENQTNVDGAGIGGFDDVVPPIMIEDGAKIRLYHVSTDRRLHSHDVRPPVTEADWQNEVSAYGHKGFAGDVNDVFRVEVVPHLSEGTVAKTRLRTIQTKFRLIHTLTGCALFSHKVKLPEWGFEQQEVTCAKSGTLPNSVWYIEQNEHPQLKGPDVEKVTYAKPGFVGKFWELQKVMWRTNAGLVESHAWDSRPEIWPFLKRGINFWGKDHRQIYLVGNPLIWWTSTAAIIVYVIFKAIAVLRWQRGYTDYQNENVRRFDFEVGTAILGWALHYFPFYLMKRQLFLHHYFPALFFAIAAVCQIFDFVTHRIKNFGLSEKPALGWIAAIVFLALSIVVFGLFQPLAYGNPWTKTQCKQMKLLSGWDWDCSNFFDTYEQYASFASSASVSGAAQPTVPKPVEDPKQEKINQEKRIEEIKAKGAPPPNDDTTGVPQGRPIDQALAGKIIKREEHVEYRDQDGNLLNEEQIKELEGKVEFKTRYETKTRLLDQDGNELPEGYQIENGDILEVVEPAPRGVNEETSAQVEKGADEEHTKYVEYQETVVVDEAGNIISTEKPGMEVVEPSIHTETVYVDPENEGVETVSVEAPKQETVVVEVEVEEVKTETVTVEVEAEGEPEHVTVTVEAGAGDEIKK
ncbi:Dolichyl-phosphate-mannose-protein mannosyltransferase-domain-containing protein [Tirmania nivea]|nr:Dolichyl-phosphate-mannose-protein mannosyltransferase-domain-containing protein [Tirmania nivea]